MEQSSGEQPDKQRLGRSFLFFFCRAFLSRSLSPFAPSAASALLPCLPLARLLLPPHHLLHPLLHLPPPSALLLSPSLPRLLRLLRPFANSPIRLMFVATLRLSLRPSPPYRVICVLLSTFHITNTLIPRQLTPIHPSYHSILSNSSKHSHTAIHYTTISPSPF